MPALNWVNSGTRMKPRKTPMIPPMAPRRIVSVRNIIRIWCLEKPLVDSSPISRLLRLKETSETVVPMYHATKKIGREMIVNVNWMDIEVNRNVLRYDPRLFVTLMLAPRSAALFSI